MKYINFNNFFGRIITAFLIIIYLIGVLLAWILWMCSLGVFKGEDIIDDLYDFFDELIKKVNK